MSRSIAVAVILGLASALSLPAASAATFVVNSTLDVQDDRPGDGVCATATASCTLRAAITEANALAGADVITLPAGTYTSTLVSANDDANLGGDFDINSDVTINGVDSRTTFVQAATTPGVATERVFHLRYLAPGTAAVLSNMTIRHGRYTDGSYGAGVRVDGGAVVATLNNLTISNNQANRSGGGIAITSAYSITTLNGCVVESNTAGDAGSGGSIGGGIMFDNPLATLNLNNSRVSSNVISADGLAQGGGIYSFGTLSINNSVISNNMVTSSGADSSGGGIRISNGTATILDSIISGNVSTSVLTNSNGLGGGISSNQANVVISNSIIAQNAATRSAGISTSSGVGTTTTTITDSSIRNNTAVRAGGGITNGATTMTISGSTITGNIVTEPTGTGGGLRNVAGASAVLLVNVTNSTISGNIAARGAGSFNEGTNAAVNFNFATIADNTATSDGGGVLQGSTGTTILKNSIVADNAAATDADISGVVTSAGYNHVENVSGATFTLATGDVVGTDPQLGELANNGGITITHLPEASSPVINAIPFGINDCANIVSTSQNGMVRPQQVGCEKGSVEVDTNFLFHDGFDGTGTAGTPLADQALDEGI